MSHEIVEIIFSPAVLTLQNRLLVSIASMFKLLILNLEND